VTIDDIARQAGVSNTTVSNVINGRAGRVSRATIDRINAIIDETGYVPNMSARALASSSSKVVAIINHLDPNKSGNFMEDPFHNTLLGAVEQSLKEVGYYLMVRTVSDGDDLKAFLRNWNVDGLFLSGVLESESLYPTLKSLSLPVVLTDSYLSDYKDMVNVGLQDFEGARLATEYLLNKGHRRIVFAGPARHPGGVVQQRFDGYKKALADAKVPFDPALVFESEFSTRKTMELGSEIPRQTDATAVFATADIMAAGIMSGLSQGGYRVPEDFSVVGFDDINWCRMTNPMLTTIAQDTKKKGQIAADYMICLLEGREIEQANIVLPVALVERDSVRDISV
jgi:LacI family transcriptional regulator